MRLIDIVLGKWFMDGEGVGEAVRTELIMQALETTEREYCRRDRDIGAQMEAR